MYLSLRVCVVVCICVYAGAVPTCVHTSMCRLEDNLEWCSTGAIHLVSLSQVLSLALNSPH